MSAALRPITSIFTRGSMLTRLFWLALIVLMLGLQLAGWTAELRYDRTLVEAGQWYRLITANFVHLNFSHLAMNLAALILVLVFFSSHLKTIHWLLLLLISSAAVTGGLYLFDSGLQRYVGFSGTVNALFLAGALVEIRRYPLSGWLLLAVLVGKIVWEQLYGAMPGSASFINARVIVDAHLYGAISGLIYMIVINWKSIKQNF